VALDVAAAADAIAVVSRDRSGALQLTTNHGAPGEARWGVFWVLLLETLFPRRRSDQAARRGRSRSARRADAALDDPFRGYLRDMLAPGTSVLFLAVETGVSDEAVRELTRLGGILVTWGLTVDAAGIVQAAMRGIDASGAGGRLWPADGGTSSPDTGRAAPRFRIRPGETCGSI
jgi:uncharacterized membrane protein